ncbi:hypothetical protein BO85DRAFT_511272 [Aspergillus piperis CBS 112811]|uniref:Uncharacterized protein n=1 Tax=Aspergillus piperis CBS 112811 TaxID=1448313 RepID=A0A8G1R5I6_9EURO|nr:hypothetical protein BO85DRAFT_511272 [Aspergillus piperis CBS 112811]RAH58887.1 hypothetical protein BO85DRAFT_511272 [Aspergillus piperis CBS 112811]
MPWSLGKSLGLIGRGQEPLSFSLTGSPTLCANTPYISDLNASRLLSTPDRTEADARWTYHTERDYEPEDSFKEHAVLCLPCCHHTEDNQPGMDDTPLDRKARNALEEYSNSFDEYRLLKRSSILLDTFSRHQAITTSRVHQDHHTCTFIQPQILHHISTSPIAPSKARRAAFRTLTLANEIHHIRISSFQTSPSHRTPKPATFTTAATSAVSQTSSYAPNPPAARPPKTTP